MEMMIVDISTPTTKAAGTTMRILISMAKIAGTITLTITPMSMEKAADTITQITRIKKEVVVDMPTVIPILTSTTDMAFLKKVVGQAA